MELTKGEFDEIAKSVWHNRSNTSMEEWLHAIESDRQRVRAEAIAEVKRDHFKVGEKVELLSDFWTPVTIGFSEGPGHFHDDISNGSFHFRRTPKTRPMTREEKIEALLKRFTPQQVCEGIGTDDGIDAYCELAKIDTEVTDEAP